MNIKEKIHQLERKLAPTTNFIINNFLDGFYQKNQRIRNAVFNLLEHHNGKFIDPLFGVELDSFELKSIFGKWKEMDSMYEELQEVISNDLQKLDIDKEKIFPVKYSDIWKIGYNLRKCLDEDNILDEVIKLQQANETRAMHWMASVKSINSIFLSKPFVWDKEKKTCTIPWPILVDSYVRDFELLFKYIIRPYLYKDEKHDTYDADLRKFFDSNKKFLSLVQKDIIKPWLRSRLAHHQYCIDRGEKKIIFFKHDEDEESIKELLIDDLIKLAINMNLFLWNILFILFENDYEIQTNETNIFNIKRKEHLFSNYQSFYEIENVIKKICEKNIPNPKLILLFENSIKNDKISFVFNESFIYYLVHFEKQDANWFYFHWILSKVAFLVAHSVMMDRFIKPIAISLNKKLDYRSSEKDLLKEVVKYRDGAFNTVFNWVDLELRNNLAHYAYEIDEEKGHFYLNDNKKKIYFKISPLSKLHMIFDRLEVAFNTKYEEDLFDFGIVKIILLLFYRDEDLKTKEFYRSGIEILSGNKKYNFLGLLCQFVIFFFLIEDNKIMEAKNVLIEISKDLQKLDDKEIELIWAWIIKRNKIFMPTKSNMGIMKIINLIKIYPKNDFTKIFLGIFYYNNKQFTKARRLLKNI